MERPKPKTYVMDGKPMFAYYEPHEVNVYLAEKELQIDILKSEVKYWKIAAMGPK